MSQQELDLGGDFVPGVVTGVRCWELMGNQLIPIGINQRQLLPWTPGENVAVCPKGATRFPETTVWKNKEDGSGLEEVKVGGHGLIPALNCLCGFWLLTSFSILAQKVNFRPNHIIGEVEGYGRVVEADFGYRVEKARITKLYQVSGYGLVSVEAVAKLYGVPVESLDLDVFQIATPPPNYTTSTTIGTATPPTPGRWETTAASTPAWRTAEAALTELMDQEYRARYERKMRKRKSG